MIFRVVCEFFGPLITSPAIEKGLEFTPCLGSGPAWDARDLFVSVLPNRDALPALIRLPYPADKTRGVLAMSSDNGDFIGDLGGAFDPGASLKSLGGFVDRWCRVTPEAETSRETASFAAAMGELPSYVAVSLADLAKHRPLIAKVAFARLNVLDPRSRLRQDPELQSALADRAAQSMSVEILQERTESILSRFVSFAPLYFEEEARNLCVISEQEKARWKKAAASLPPACLELLDHPDLSAAAFLFFANRFGLSHLGYPDRE
jgi:hypothetical protein